VPYNRTFRPPCVANNKKHPVAIKNIINALLCPSSAAIIPSNKLIYIPNTKIYIVPPLE